jgi:hypothetical protein
MRIGALVKQIAQMVFRQEMAKVHTNLPAQVVSYDDAENVQPCLKRLRTNDPDSQFVQLPQIDDVPVKQFGSGKLLFSVAPKAGSYGALYICERDLTEWLLKGGIVDPRNTRKFDIGSGWFDPGLYPLVDDGDNGKIAGGINTDRIELRTRTGDTSIAVLEDETIEVNNASGTITIKSSGQVDINGNLTVDP